MAASNLSGPQFITGPTDSIPASLNPGGPFGQGFPVPDYNDDAGPNVTYKVWSQLDFRLPFFKDQVQGFKGKVQAALYHPCMVSIDTIPFALSTTIIAAAANAVSGTAMTLASANAAGVTVNIPIIPWSGIQNGGAVVTAPIVLDFGFAFGTGTAGQNTVTVGDATQFATGMPLVIAGAGNSAGTLPLLTWVTAINTSTNVITINDNLVASISGQPIGAGNIWTPNEVTQTSYPTAHAPFQANGPGLFLDPVQAISRVVSITSASGAAGGNFLIKGWDEYWQPMSQLVNVSGASTTAYSTKTFKAIQSVTPQFSDAHNYSVGTGDVFGFGFRCDEWEQTDVIWAAATMTASTGFTKADATSPATTSTGDVRGTIQTGTGGGGSGIGSTASNGSVSSNALTGRRLWMTSVPRLFNIIRGTYSNPVPFYGVPQV